MTLSLDLEAIFALGRCSNCLNNGEYKLNRMCKGLIYIFSIDTIKRISLYKFIIALLDL